MKRILTILLLIVSFYGSAQTDQLPTGSISYGNQTYLSPAGDVWVGISSKKFRKIATQRVADSLIALKLDLTSFNNFQTSTAAALALKLDISTYQAGILLKADKTSFDNYVASNNTALGNKVDKVTGARLITNEETQVIKTALPKIDAVLSKQITAGKFQVLNAGFSDGVQTNVSSQIVFVPKITFTGLVMPFSNAIIGLPQGSAGEQFGLNDITVRASVYDGATRRRINFRGQSTVTIAPGVIVKNDPLPITFVKGRTYYLFVNVSVATAGQKWPVGLTIQPSLGEKIVQGDNTDADQATTLANTPYYHPLAIMGTPCEVVNYGNILIIGNSIAEGKSNGGTGINVDQGYIRRALDALNLPWVRCAIGGGTMSTLYNPYKPNGTITSIGMSSITGSDVCISEFLVNDIQSFTSLDDAKAKYIDFWNALKAGGVKYLVQATGTPRTTGGNATQEALRVGLNAWFRTLPAPLNNYIEASDKAETARDSGIWKTGYSTDGVHPTVTAEIDMATSITLEKLGLSNTGTFVSKDKQLLKLQRTIDKPSVYKIAA